MIGLGRLSGMLMFGALIATAGGCDGGGSSSQPRRGDPSETFALAEVGEAYRAYSIAKNGPPKKVADLSTVEGIGGNGVASMKVGEILVQWGATLPDLGEEPGKVSSPEILAYQKQVPEQGGYVLMLDRTIKKMTAEEFNAAPKPAGTSAAPSAAAKKK